MSFLNVFISICHVAASGTAVSVSDRFKQTVRKAVLWYSVRNRHRKAANITTWLAGHHVRDVLFVGAMGDEHAGNADMVNAGIVEKRIADSYDVKMGINIGPAITPYPFMIADARDMPFEDDYVDFALANAIIERRPRGRATENGPGNDQGGPHLGHHDVEQVVPNRIPYVGSLPALAAVMAGEA